ncbi:MAG: histidine triad nucleotide-binding protein [Dethiobacteria bacterium]
MKDCIFCKIVAGEAPAEVVYEDERVLAFKDINPLAPVHILIVPRLHLATLNDLQPEHKDLVSHIFKVAIELAHKFKIDKGYRVVTNCGADGGQIIFHLHFHLLGGKVFDHNLV